MLIATALLLASPALQPEAEVPTAATDPYRCSVAVEMAGLAGAMWRDFQPGRPDEYYKIQINNPEVASSIFAIWLVDNRPPRRPRAYGYDVGVPEADAFRNGPDHVNFDRIDHGRIPDGPISARLFGDGVHAGTIPVQSAKNTRRAYRLGAQGLSLSISRSAYPDIFPKLGRTTRWEAVLVDSSGRELGRKTVRLPSPAEARAGFDRARLELLRRRDEFLARPTWNRTRACSTHIDELDSPI